MAFAATCNGLVPISNFRFVRLLTYCWHHFVPSHRVRVNLHKYMPTAETLPLQYVAGSRCPFPQESHKNLHRANDVTIRQDCEVVANGPLHIPGTTIESAGSGRRSVAYTKVALLFLSAHFASRPLNAVSFAYHPHSQSNVYSP